MKKPESNIQVFKARLERLLSLQDSFGWKAHSLLIFVGSTTEPAGILAFSENVHKSKTILYLYPPSIKFDESDLYDGILRNSRVILAPFELNDTFFQLLNDLIIALKIDDGFQISILIDDLLGNQYSQQLDRVKKFVILLAGNNKTKSSFRLLYSRNSINNFPLIVKNHGIRVRPLPPDAPTIICGAGPSLNKQFDILQELSSKCHIITVGRVAESLINAGINVDCVVDIDLIGHINFSNNCEMNCPLVAPPIVSPLTAQHFQRIFWFQESSSPFSELLKSFSLNLPEIALSRSVIISTIDFAVRAGFKNIALIGNDLCFSNHGHAHVISDPGKGEVGAADSMDFLELPGNDEVTVKSNLMYSGIKEALEKYLVLLVSSNQDVTIYNCTKGGARIENSSRISLEDFAQSFVKEMNLKRDLFEIDTSNANMNIDIYPLLNDFNLFMEVISGILNDSRKLLREFGNVSPKHSRIIEYQTSLQKYLSEDSKFRELVPVKYLLSPIYEQVDKYIHDMPIRKPLPDSTVDQIEFMRLPYELTKDIARDFQKDLIDVCERLRNPDVSHDISVSRILKFNCFRKYSINRIARHHQEFSNFLERNNDLELGAKWQMHSSLGGFPFLRMIQDDNTVFKFSELYSMQETALCEINAFLNRTSFNPEEHAVIFIAPGNWIHVVEFSKRFPSAQLMLVEPWPELLSVLISESFPFRFIPDSTIIISTDKRFKKWEKIIRKNYANWLKSDKEILFFEEHPAFSLSEVQDLHRKILAICS